MKKVLAYLSLLSLFIQPLYVEASLTDDLQKQIQEKQTQIKELEKQIAQYKETIKSKKSEAATLQNQINKLEGQIKYLQTQIKLTQAKISETSLKIEEFESGIQAQEKALNRQKESLAAVLVTIDRYDQETPFEMILENETFSSFFNQFQYIKSLQNSVQTKLTEIKNLKENLQIQKTEQESQKQQLENLKSQLRGQSLVLDNQKDEKGDLLTTTKSQEKKYQAVLSDLEKKRLEIEREINLLEDKLRLTIDPSSIPGAKAGLLAWPLKNPLTQTYGPTSQTGFKNPYYSFHNGIDIEADIGDPIRAALTGTVSGTGNLGKYSYGKWVTIKHENGLTTLYAHLSAPTVSVGRKVTTGQIIGYAGSSGFSTGPHLHFTVYATNTFRIEQKWYGPLPLGGTLNPLLYL